MSKLQTISEYHFKRNAPKLNGNTRGTLSTSEKYPIVEGTEARPTQESNIKQQSKTYNTGMVPAVDHNRSVFSNKTMNERLRLYKTENAIYNQKNKKFSDNNMKIKHTAMYKQYP